MTGASLVTIPETIAGPFRLHAVPPLFLLHMRIETIEMEKLLCLLNAIFPESSPDFLIGLLIYKAVIVKHKSQRIIYCPHGPTLS